MARRASVDGEGLCLCGCGGEPKPGRHYLPGHDSTLRKNIRQAIEAGTTLKIYGKRWDPIDYLREHNVHMTPVDIAAAQKAGVNVERKKPGRKAVAARR